MRRLYRGADAVLTDSTFARDEFLTLSGARNDVHVVYPGVDERFARIVRRPRTRPLALVVGTVERRKNLLRAVETLAAVPRTSSSLAVGPTTPYLDVVRARVSELGLGERVALRGYVESSELDALYASATVALVPSRYEGFGYALAEALCAGLPVIAARSSSLDRSGRRRRAAGRSRTMRTAGSTPSARCMADRDAAEAQRNSRGSLRAHRHAVRLVAGPPPRAPRSTGR